MDRRAVVQAHRILARAYGPLPRIPAGDPLGQLVQTILSQNTSDVNSDRAYRSLRRRFPTWEKVLRAPAAAIAASIRHGGLANTKAPRIKEVLRLIREREGRLSLARLSRMADPAALDYLTSLPGVGIKTAACVLLFALRRPVMPVDTHVDRVTRRLGWIGPRTRIEDAGALIARHTPARRMLELHVYLVWHGRRTCKALRPRCRECPLRRNCRFAARKSRIAV